MLDTEIPTAPDIEPSDDKTPKEHSEKPLAKDNRPTSDDSERRQLSQTNQNLEDMVQKQAEKDEKEVNKVRERLRNLGGGGEKDEVRGLVIDAIQKGDGKITFEKFMNLSLYANLPAEEMLKEGAGYYSSGKVQIGASKERDPDFTTSPEFSPVFGHSIARQLEEMWSSMGKPEKFDIVEMGAGNGVLAKQILTYMQRDQPELFSAAKYKILEISQGLIHKQRENLRELPVEWVLGSASSLPLRGINGVFLSNELVDAFPVHKLVKEGGTLKEKYVTYENGRLKEISDEVSDPRLKDYANNLGYKGVDITDGEELFVNLQAVNWMRGVASALNKGYVITIDYGDTAPDFYQSDSGNFRVYPDGTNPKFIYDFVGDYDMTADVDFSPLMKEGEKSGLKSIWFGEQAQFLEGLGYSQELISAYKRSLAGVLETNSPTINFKNAANHLLGELSNITANYGSGTFKVLVQGKNTKGIDTDKFPISNIDFAKEIEDRYTTIPHPDNPTEQLKISDIKWGELSEGEKEKYFKQIRNLIA